MAKKVRTETDWFKGLKHAEEYIQREGAIAIRVLRNPQYAAEADFSKEMINGIDDYVGHYMTKIVPILYPQ